MRGAGCIVESEEIVEQTHDVRLLLLNNMIEVAYIAEENSDFSLILRELLPSFVDAV